MEPTPRPVSPASTRRLICLALGTSPLLCLLIAVFLQVKGGPVVAPQMLGPGLALAGVVLLYAGFRVGNFSDPERELEAEPGTAGVAAFRRTLVSMALIEGGGILAVVGALVSRRNEFYLGAPLATFLILRQWPREDPE